MNFEQFKDAARKTGISFNMFFKTEFVRATPIETGVNTPVFVAESAKHFTLYYPNNRGGATLVKGFGAAREIEFYDSVESISPQGF